MKLSSVAAKAGIRVVRDGEFECLGLLCHQGNKLLVMFYDDRYMSDLIGNSSIECVLTRPDKVAMMPANVAIGVSDDPMVSFYQLHEYLCKETEFYGQSFASEVSSSAWIHPTAWIAETGVRIARGAQIQAKAVILEGSVIGEDVVVGPGVVIGGEGFEPKNVGGTHRLIRHAGGVWLHDRVEILANSHVAKAVFNGNTDIGEDTKIDALVQIAHNVKIGRSCEIAAQACIAGSTTIGDNVWIGPCASVSSSISVGDNAFVALGSVVVKDVRPADRVFGVPARSIKTSESS